MSWPTKQIGRVDTEFGGSDRVTFAFIVTVRPLSPMLASSAAQLPRGAGWSYEVKWDGYRTLAIRDDSRVKLLSRNLKDATRLYPTVAQEVARLHAESVPRIVVEVSFVEWTREGLLRHPEFVGLRGDKSPREVGREDG